MPSPSPSQEPPPSVEEICRVVRAQRTALTSFDIEVDTSEEHFVDPETILKYWGRSGFHNGKERFAFKGGKRYMQLRVQRTTAKFDDRSRPVVTPDMPPAVQEYQRQRQEAFDSARKISMEPRTKYADPDVEKNRPEVLRMIPKDEKDRTKPPFPAKQVYNGKTLWIHQNALNGQIHLANGRYAPGNQFAFPFLQLSAVYIEDPTQKSELSAVAKAIMFPGLLKRFAYSITADVLDGVRCWRLDGQCGTDADGWAFKDRWWLDPSKGYVPLRREGFEPHSEKPLWRALFTELREVTPGWWLPMLTTVEEFAPSYAPPELGKKPLSITRYRVTRCEFDVPDDLFEYQFPKGTIVADWRDSRMKSPALYREGENPLDESIFTVQGVSDFSLWLLVSIGVGGLLLAAGAVVLWRRGPQNKPA